MFAVRELHLSPGMIGLIFSVGAAGSLTAAFTSMRISARFGIGPTSIVDGGAVRPTFLLVAFAPAGNAAIPFLVAAQLVFGFTVVVYNIVQVSYRQAICPPRLQGRMNSVMRFMVWGTIPLGTLAGGALATWIGLRETIVVGAVGGGFAFLVAPVLARSAICARCPSRSTTRAVPPPRRGWRKSVPSLSA